MVNQTMNGRVHHIGLFRMNDIMDVHLSQTGQEGSEESIVDGLRNDHLLGGNGGNTIGRQDFLASLGSIYLLRCLFLFYLLCK